MSEMSKMYSPTQIGVGTFLGGPIAAIYFLKTNFDTLGKTALSKKTLQIGVMLTFALILALPFIPDSVPNNIIPIMYLIPVIMIVKNYQLTKEQILNSDEYAFQSNWKVVGHMIGWMLLFFVISMAFFMALDSMGMISF
jgi:hypothetical protein